MFKNRYTKSLVITILFCSAQVFAQETVTITTLGDAGPGPYEISNDHKLIFVVASVGHVHANKAKAYQEAFNLAVTKWKQSGKSARTTTAISGNQNYKLTNGRKHVIIGVADYDNPNNQYWVGAHIYKKDACKTLTSSGKSLDSGEFHHYKKNFLDRKIVFAIADNDNGGVIWRFDDN